MEIQNGFETVFDSLPALELLGNWPILPGPNIEIV